MKLNNKGFAISTIMYLILVIAIILIVSILSIFSSRRFILEKQKSEALEDIYPSGEYTLIYNNNGGSGCSNKTVDYGSEIGELCIAVRTGYDFIGWFTNEYKDIPMKYYGEQHLDVFVHCNSTYDIICLYNHLVDYGKTEGRRKSQYVSTDIYNVEGDTTIYAGWHPNRYTITYDNNGGSGCSSKYAYYNSEIGDLCTPTRSGYTFNGWYDEDYTSEYTSSTIYNYTSNITLYAKWEKIYPSVTIINSNYLITPSEHSTKSRATCITSDTECDSIRINNVSYNDSTGYLSLKATINMNNYYLTSAGQCSVRQVCIAKVGTTDCSIDLAQYDIDDDITGGWLAVGKSRVLFNGSVSLSSLSSGSYRIIAKNTDSTCNNYYKNHFTFTRDDTTRIPLLITVN